MKSLLCAFLIVLALAFPAFAVFASKGVIPGAEPIEYRGLKITDKGVNVVIVNRGEKTYEFSAALSFVTGRKELADTFIEKIVLAPEEHKQLTGLFLKGDVKSAKKADSLKWTLYTFEENAGQ